MKSKLTEAQRLKIRELRSENLPLNVIAEQFKVSKATVSMVCRCDRPAYHIELEVPSTMGERLRNWRQRRELDRVSAAAQAGVSTSSWINYELDRADPPSKVLRMICENLHISADYLLGLA